jgi:hypothetical protein
VPLPELGIVVLSCYSMASNMGLQTSHTWQYETKPWLPTIDDTEEDTSIGGLVGYPQSRVLPAPQEKSSCLTVARLARG